MFTGVPGVDLYSLQQAPRSTELGIMGAFPLVKDLAPHFKDWANTAAAISKLDLIVTVDTAVAHLAGTLHKPCFVLLGIPCDWRWMLHREDSPWYPSLRLFRQPKPGDWASVVAAVKRAVDGARS